MKIGIDIREAAQPLNGKGQYTLNLVRELLRLDRKNEYVLYTNRVSAELAVFAGAEIKFIPGNELFWHFKVIRNFQGDLFFSPTSFIIPAFLPKKIRSVITVHDLITFLFPRRHQMKALLMEHLFLPRALKKATCVFVPSENTKKDLMRLFGYPAKKITVTPLGSTERAQAGEVSFANIQKKFGLPKKFILTVGTLAPRKNIEMLVDVMMSLSNHDTKLIIAGSAGWRSKKLLKKIAALKNHIIHIPNASRDCIEGLYRNAELFVFPSLYEGFGLPPLEAMANGCPVLCSDAASLPEVCGDAALYFNPHKPEALAEALKKALTDEKLRAQLAQKGLVQAKKFSWQRTAELTLRTLMRT